MDESFGRTAGPTTETGAPDGSGAHEPRPTLRGRVRDVPPASPGYPDNALSDPDARPRSVDPLDPRRPGRPNDDPLDPDGHLV